MTVPPTSDSPIAAAFAKPSSIMQEQERKIAAEMRRLDQSARTALSTARSLVFLSTLAAVLSFIAILRTC